METNVNYGLYLTMLYKNGKQVEVKAQFLVGNLEYSLMRSSHFRKGTGEPKSGVTFLNAKILSLIVSFLSPRHTSTITPFGMCNCL